MALFGRNRMAPNEDVVENVDVEDNEDEGQEEEEKPQYATIADMQAMIEAQGQQMQNTLTTLLQPKEAAPASTGPAAPELIPEVSDEEIMQAMEDGEHAKVLKLQKQQRARDKQIAQYEMDQLRHQGAQWVSGVTQKMAQEKLPNYAKYKKEIDSVLLTFPAHLRADEEVVQFVYNSVRGKHIEEEIEQRMKEDAEAKKRQANLDANPGTPTGGRRATGRTVEDEDSYFSDVAHERLRRTGRSADEQARKWGYKNWAEYEAMAKKYDEEYYETENHGHKWLKGV